MWFLIIMLRVSWTLWSLPEYLIQSLVFDFVNSMNYKINMK